jgi:hypothetical protein
LDSSRFCDECGTRLEAQSSVQPPAVVPPPAYVPPPPSADVSGSRSAHVTSVGIPPLDLGLEPNRAPVGTENGISRSAHATLVIERGDAPGAEFRLTGEESIIGRWDADNGVFPDVDLDAFDQDAKVSRRHARIRRTNGGYVIEDLGSTNGTYVNRGRRLIPGNAEALNDGDEVIVGKTFLRFRITH